MRRKRDRWALTSRLALDRASASVRCALWRRSSPETLYQVCWHSECSPRVRTRQSTIVSRRVIRRALPPSRSRFSSGERSAIVSSNASLQRLAGSG